MTGSGGPDAGPRQRARARWSRASCAPAASRDERVLAAMGAVPREAFVARAQARARLRRRGAADRGRPDDQPAVHGRPDDRAARRRDRATGSSRSGPGSGYQAAILAALGCRGHVDRAPARDLAAAARARLAALGLRRPVDDPRRRTAASATPDGAPWDGIIVDGRRAGRPRARCASSSADGGRLVHPGRAARPAGADSSIDPARRRVDRADRTAPASSCRSSAPAASATRDRATAPRSPLGILGRP